MFKTSAVVQVKDGAKVLAKQEYDKIVFHGTSEEDGKVIGGEPTDLLAKAIKYFQEKVGEKGNGVLELLSAVTYAHDLEVRNKLRSGLVAAIAGPEKAIEKSIKDFMAARAAAGRPVTEEVARQKVMAMMAD